jgi:UDP-glucose 4-epimerase
MSMIKEFYQNKKILITGGAGFIGSHLTEKLVSLGTEVTILDNFSTGKLSNLASVLPKININYADITSFTSCQEAVKNKDIIFHLAAFVSVHGSIKNPSLCLSTNVQGTKNLLQACIKNNPSAHFIYSSSSAVYGNKKNQCFETDTPKPLSIYAKSKLEGEKECLIFFNTAKLKITILRYFNVFGERQNPHGPYAGVVAQFTKNLDNNQPLIIYGTGKQTRDFIHVSKIVKANIIMPLLSSSIGNIYNVASGKSINLLELITTLKQKLQKERINTIFKPQRSGDIFSSQANCQKLQKLMCSINAKYI